MEISKERVRSPTNVDDEYLCPICYHLLWKPVECQNCQRFFCKQCIDNCVKEKPGVCPLCQHYQAKRCSPMFYALLCKFKIECVNKCNGCNGVLLYESLEKHQNEQCQYQPRICRGCEKNVFKYELEQHEQMCGEIEIQCKRCYFVYKQKEKHEQLDCVLNLLEQNNIKIGLLEKTVETSQKTIEHLQETVEQMKQELERNYNNGNSSFLAKLSLRTVDSLMTQLELGVAHDIPLLTLFFRWNIIYDYPYNHATTVEELRALKSKCNERILVGAIEGSSSTIMKLGAMGPSEVLSLNSPLNQPTKYGNVHWYLTPEYSFGFAPSTTTINCNTADSGEKDNSESRLSWHLGSGGWRAGTAENLYGHYEWRKIIMTERL